MKPRHKKNSRVATARLPPPREMQQQQKNTSLVRQTTKPSRCYRRWCLQATTRERPTNQSTNPPTNRVLAENLRLFFAASLETPSARAPRPICSGCIGLVAVASPCHSVLGTISLTNMPANRRSSGAPRSHGPPSFRLQ